jgi:hypothetical protein
MLLIENMKKLKKPRKKKGVKKKRKSLKDAVIEQERAKNVAILKKANARGALVDFTKRKLGSLSERDRKIIKCKRCGQKGERSELGMSTLVIHRGIAKPGNMLPVHGGARTQQRIKITEFCVV